MSTHRHKKRFGQHFLIDGSVVERILLAVDPAPGDHIVEIGPGAGALSLPLLRQHGALTAIEFDRDLVGPLRAAAARHGDLELLEADVLGVDFSALAAGGSLRLVGNLPYNISSPILFHCLAHAQNLRDMHFMLQREVVERMAAAPGRKTYGRLSVMVQASAEVEALFTVPAAAFDPPPKVESAVVRIVPRDPADVGIDDAEVFAHVVRHAFGQRRKTLRNALARVCDTGAIESAGIRPDLRAEQVEVGAYIALANQVADRAGIAAKP